MDKIGKTENQPSKNFGKKGDDLSGKSGIMGTTEFCKEHRADSRCSFTLPKKGGGCDGREAQV